MTGTGETATATATVTVGPGAGSTRLIPIVLSVGGVGGARFSTELTLANRGSTPATVILVYTAASSLSATGSGTVTTSLEAGRQVVIADTVAYLRSRGLKIPDDGSSQGGTLFVGFGGLSSADAAFASARTTTQSGTGRAGLSYPGLRFDAYASLHGIQSGTSWLYGLRENAADRTNIGLVNASLAYPVTLSVSLFDGSGAGMYRLSPDVTLGPGQWTQISHVLALAGFASGFARIDVQTGPFGPDFNPFAVSPYYAYAVIGDNVTNDGSFVAPESGYVPPGSRILPVLVETSAFQSELVLTNAYSSPQSVTLSYVESLAPSAGSGTAVIALGPGEQRIIPGAIDFLRQHGVPIGPRGAAGYGGTLSVLYELAGSASDGFVGARTSTAAPAGGEYGVFYTALSAFETALTEAWVFGLQQNATARSNLGVASTGDAGTGITFHVDVYDGDTGRLAGRSGDYTLPPKGWTQIGNILQPFGVSNGYVRVVRSAGEDTFLAYGILNDGATPTSGGTNDGSYIDASNP
jgi:hypothetical protein